MLVFVLAWLCAQVDGGQCGPDVICGSRVHASLYRVSEYSVCVCVLLGHAQFGSDGKGVLSFPLFTPVHLGVVTLHCHAHNFPPTFPEA